VDEVESGPAATSLRPFGAEELSAVWTVGNSRAEVVNRCSEMAEGYGVSVAVSRRDASRPGEVGADTLGTCTLRVKAVPDRALRMAPFGKAVPAPPAEDMEYAARWGEEDSDYETEAEVLAKRALALEDAAAAVAAGFTLVESDFGLEATTRCGYVAALGVAKMARRRGVASNLLKWCETKARAWGLPYMALHCSKTNSDALRFYLANGYEVAEDWLGLGPGFFLLLKRLD